jgi:hypothetical protein
MIVRRRSFAPTPVRPDAARAVRPEAGPGGARGTGRLQSAKDQASDSRSGVSGRGLLLKAASMAAIPASCIVGKRCPYTS